MIVLKFFYGFFLSLLKKLPFRFLEIFGNIFPEDSYGCKFRGYLYRPFFKKCGRNLQVGLNVKFEHLKNIQFGCDVYIGHGSWISGLRGGIVFEDEVMLGPYVKIVSSNHRFNNRGSARFKQGVGELIHIGYGTWIASGVTITSGVRIGKCCLIGAGSVVTKSFDESLVIGGVPAKVLNKNNYEENY